MFNRGVYGDTPPAAKDVLLFTNGEKLIGQLQRADSGSVVFNSDMAGVVTVDWKKIQQLRSAKEVVLIRKGTKLVWHEKYQKLEKGQLTANAQTLQVQPPAEPQHSAQIPVDQAEDVMPAADFETAVNRRPNIFQGWKGSASLGIALVEATQTSQTYTSSVSLTRSLPLENWLEPSNRTLLNFTSAYGNLSQPGTPTVKTSIFHATAERDEYFSPTLYVLADAGFDHDYSQGLDLQQSYGAGIGWTAIKGPNESLDLKAELGYLNQQFFNPSENQKLLGSIFSEGYDRKFAHNIQLHEALGINPAWTNLRAYSANGVVSLTIPVLKRVGFNVTAADTFLNDPSLGFRKNSFQFSTNMTYTLP